MKDVTTSLIIGLLLVGCTTKGKPHQKVSPAEVLKTGDVVTLVLTLEAQKRLGVAAESAKSDGKISTVPASSILYDTQGATWVYLETGSRTYQRHSVDLVRIQNHAAIIRAPLPDGSRCVFEGAAELYGTESGVGK